ncbi:MAG: hypothetical protein ACLPVY_08945 [Acidimicrobiia bacterium]
MSIQSLETALRDAAADLPADSDDVFERVLSRARRRRSRRRVAVVVGAAGALLALIVALVGLAPSGGSHVIVSGPVVVSTPDSNAPNTSTSTYIVPMQHFASYKYGLALDYPRAWHEVYYADTGSFSSSIIFLGTAAIHDPCTTTYYSNGQLEGISCSYAIKSLRPGDVFVSWFTIANAGGGPAIPHPNTKIAGRLADVTTERPGQCSQFGGQETITADIAEPPLDDKYEMLACLRGPNLAREDALVRRMLSSVHIRT